VALPGGADAFAATASMLTGPVRAQFAGALHRVFLAGAMVSAAGLFATFFLPAVSFARGVPDAAGEQLIQAEMTNLEPEDEPVAIPE
jgi:hypothetical protein